MLSNRLFTRPPGADTSHLDAEGKTVMHYAFGSVDISHLNELLARRVDPNPLNPVSGLTPLMITALYERGPQMHALIAAGAKLEPANPTATQQPF